MQSIPHGKRTPLDLVLVYGGYNNNNNNNSNDNNNNTAVAAKSEGPGSSLLIEETLHDRVLGKKRSWVGEENS